MIMLKFYVYTVPEWLLTRSILAHNVNSNNSSFFKSHEAYFMHCSVVLGKMNLPRPNVYDPGSWLPKISD